MRVYRFCRVDEPAEWVPRSDGSIPADPSLQHREVERVSQRDGVTGVVADRGAADSSISTKITPGHDL